MSARVLIIGRPNVGKSTLFNRITGRRKAITEDTPGVTRDLIEEKVSWKGKSFTLIDSGGLLTDAKELIEKEIKKRVQYEAVRSDLILFVLDAKSGILPEDEEIGRFLQRWRDKTLLVVNKVDSMRDEKWVPEFFKLGFDEVFPVSSLHGTGVAELLDRVIELIPEGEGESHDGAIRITFAGKPNSGKSSLINAILGIDRVIVSPQAGTTRDSVDIPFEWNSVKMVLIDTAGIRKPSRVSKGVEFFSVGRALKAIERAHVVCLVISAEEGVSRQDKRLAGLIERRHRACVLVVNKMDLSDLTESQWESIIRKELNFLDFAPVVFTVATEGAGVEGILEASLLCYKDFTKNHSTSYVMRSVLKVLSERPLKKGRKEVKVYYAFQEGTSPPTVVVITNYPEAWKDSYKRFFTRKLREHLGLRHSPLKLILKGR